MKEAYGENIQRFAVVLKLSRFSYTVFWGSFDSHRYVDRISRMMSRCFVGIVLT